MRIQSSTTHRHVRAVALLVAAMFAASARPTVAYGQIAPVRSIPDSIAEFGALVSRLSNAGGYFDTDNLISNEQGYQRVLNAMDRLGVRGGAYIGVGPDQNYTYIARTRPRIAFVADIRRDNMLEHLLFKALFARARNRAEYLALWTGRAVPADAAALAEASVDALVAKIDAVAATPTSIAQAKAMVTEEVKRSGIALSPQDLATIARFHDAFIAEGLSLRFTSAGRAPQPYYPTLRQLILEHDASGQQRGYLATDTDFQFIKSMHRRNLIVPVTGDLSDTLTFPRISRYLAEHGERVSVLYMSNVEDYVMRDGHFASYVAGVRTLPRDTNAVIIRSLFGGLGHPEATPEYYATQLLQRMDRFVNDSALLSVQRYRDLVLRDFVPLRVR
ncbi:MAG: hypothetical protein ABJE47_20955 [bacterium]